MELQLAVFKEQVKLSEKLGFSDYSYWKSVFQNFFKKKSAVVMAGVFFALVIFSFIALSIGKYNYSEAQIMADPALAFTSPNGEFWFGTDNLGRDYWCQVWYAAQVSIKLALQNEVLCSHFFNSCNS